MILIVLLRCIFQKIDSSYSFNYFVLFIFYMLIFICTHSSTEWNIQVFVNIWGEFLWIFILHSHNLILWIFILDSRNLSFANSFIPDTAVRLIMPWDMSPSIASILCLRCLIETVCGFHLQLNIKLYDRKQLSGQKRCRPAQVLGEKKETVGPFSSLDGYFSFFCY